jgi:glycerophosphoryl diester phosphodiesterase
MPTQLLRASRLRSMRRKLAKIVLGLVGLPAVIYGVLVVLARPIPRHPFFNHDGILVIAHRGGRGLWPENTLYAFERAVQLGVDVLEMDVHSTRDGELVVMHDDTVDRTTNGRGRIRELALAELRELDAGYTWTPGNGQSFPFRGRGLTVPTLAEVFTAFPGAAMIIEIKQSQPSIVAPLYRTILEHKMTERVLVASFDADSLRQFRHVAPEVATSAGEDEVRALYALNRLHLGRIYRPPAEALQVPEYSDDRRVVTRRFVKTAHGRNMQVHVWVVNDADGMRRLVDLGVDGIITDYPDRLLTVLGR